jgi:OmpA-OmpF porin, OOP family
MNVKQPSAALAAALLLGLGVCEPASAQSAGSYYAGASLGQSQYRNTCEFVDGSCDDKDSAYRIFGGYNFSPSMAVEVAYGDYGRLLVDGSSGGVPANFEATIEALDVSVLPAWVLSERLALFGRFGMYRSKVQVHDLGGGGSESERNSAWTYGFGVRWSFGGAVSLRAEWQRYDNIGGSSTGEDDIDFISAGVILQF